MNLKQEGSIDLLQNITLLPSISIYSIDNIHFNRLNDMYRPVIDFCKLIINGNIIDISEGDASFHCFYINSWDIYEKYLRAMIGEYLKNVYKVSKKTDVVEKAWDVNKINPDIFIWNHDKKIQLILDAKYKESITQADKNQGSNYILRILLPSEIPDENRICIYIYPKNKAMNANMNSLDTEITNLGMFYWHSIDLTKIDDDIYRKQWLQGLFKKTVINIEY